VTGQRASLLGPEDCRQIADLGLIARWIVEGTIVGLHRSPAHGFSMEFAEYREYSPGDDLRTFDWKAYGRSDRSYIKKFHSETNLCCHLILDTSASMRYGDPTKFHYGRCLAAALAFLISGQQDAVGLVLVDDAVRELIPPARGPLQVRRIHDALAAASPSSRTRMGPALHDLSESLGRRGLVVIISDFYDDDAELLGAVRHFRFKGHEVIAFHLLDSTELRFGIDRLCQFEDLETGEVILAHGSALRESYHGALNRWLSALRSGCDGCQAEYRLIQTHIPFAFAVAEYLHKRRLWRKGT